MAKKKELQVYTYPQPDQAMHQLQRRYKDFSNYLLDPFMCEDFFRMFIGHKIAAGVYRNVYNFSVPGAKTDASASNWVIKVAENNNEMNLLEWQTWQEVKNQPYGKWFAPCLMASPSGHFLVQRKCRPVKQADVKKLPKKIPQFFTDIKIENWGFIGKQICCFDYHISVRAIDYSMQATQKADWWSLTQ